VRRASHFEHDDDFIKVVFREVVFWLKRERNALD